MTSTVQLDITHLAAINLTAEDVQAKYATLEGSFQREVKKIHNTPIGKIGGTRDVLLSFSLVDDASC
ncbi:hypothetical protein Pcinc_016554 [Petrolisthes cinctipes]|uniref:Uncharacterized protein n=1 Tax=Petrolisthes cinctipes TaxID=88211 RepID=A0AAE1FQP0_PETCI|nr:hypothetical protein Pcinc_016554 [Petrolisthes cinctipes]